MLHQMLLRSLRPAVLCFGLGVLLTGCFTDDFDIDNVDLTLGVGSDGLAVKIGESDSIKLADLLEVDETIKTEPGANTAFPNRYYLVKSGTANIDFSVDRVTVEYLKTLVKTNYRVLDYEGAYRQWVDRYGVSPGEGMPLEIKTDFTPNGKAEGDAITDFTIQDISNDILEIKRAKLYQTEVSVSLHMLTSPNVKLRVDKVKDFSFTLPSYFNVSRVEPGWVLEGNVLRYPGYLTVNPGKPLSTVLINEVDMTRVSDNGRGLEPDASGTIKFDDEVSKVVMGGEVYFKTERNFTMNKGDYADVELEVKLSNGGNNIYVENVEGRFNPVIDPQNDPIDISSDLPDYLQDPSVRIKATNSTLRFNANIANIPLGLKFGAKLSAVKTGAGGFNKEVVLPLAEIEPCEQKVVYYYQGDAPYDPEGAVANAESKKVNNLGELIEQLPDRIDIDLKDRTVVKHGEDDYYTIPLNPYDSKRFEGSADYNVYVPFEFEKGLVIVYNDSTKSMNDDLKDYTAEGVIVKGNVDNSIPLNLLATLKAIDVEGNVIPGITFSTAEIAPGTFGPMPAVSGSPQRDGYRATRTPVTIEGKLDNPALLQKMDKLAFQIHAEAKDDSRNYDLLSTQYLKFVDLRLRLTGKITINAN